MFTRAGMLAPDGRCKTLDASADGYVYVEHLTLTRSLAPRFIQKDNVVLA